MLRAALALLSTFQIGARIKESFERSLRQAAVIAIAALLLLAAAVFGLLAAYDALVSISQFSTVQASAIMAGSLVVVGLLVLAAVPLLGREPKRPSPAPLVTAGEGAGLIDQGVGKVVQQVGLVPLLAVAFIAGVLAGRR